MPVVIAVLALPLLEIALFILVGGWIGLWPTLTLVVASVLAGAAILRTPGLARVPLRPVPGESLVSRVMPVAEEAARLVAGLLLILPGFVSDALAVVLLIAPLRRALIAALGRRMLREAPIAKARDAVIDGDFVDLDDTPPTHPPQRLTRH